MIKFYLPPMLLVCFSCSVHQHGYLGSSYTPTKTVDVFVDPSSIKKSYTIIGKTYFEPDTFTNLDRIQQLAIEKAKQKGANAILFQDYLFQDVGTVRTVSKVDSSSLVRLRTSAPVVTTRLDILFLKYY